MEQKSKNWEDAAEYKLYSEMMDDVENWEKSEIFNENLEYDNKAMDLDLELLKNLDEQ
jgi:hypothetical protein